MINSESLLELLAPLAANPWLQATVAGLATFILEDPTTIACGLLVAAGQMSFTAAFLGVSLGIALGDMGLYWIGRLLGDRAVSRGWIKAEQVQTGQQWADQHVLKAVAAARFIPGARLATYVTAGVLRVSFVRFAGAAILLSLIWTALLLVVTAHVGELIFEYLGPAKWLAALALLIAIPFWLSHLGKRLRGQVDKKSAEPRVVSRFEFWHPVFFYFPVGIYYLWLSIRNGGPMTPFCANPSIYSSGICRESKSQILNLVPSQFSAHLLKYIIIDRQANGGETSRVEEALRQLRESNLCFPLVAKPDEGQRGDGVQLIINEAQLTHYLEKFPRGIPVILQQLASWRNEAGVFYCRKPGDAVGRIISVTIKEFPELTGDGVRSLRELILADRRAKIAQTVYFRRHADRLHEIPAEGQKVALVFACNHCQGAIFRNGNGEITPEMERAFHQIAAAMPGFFFGRFDIKYASMDALRRGEEFEIVEINGASAECTHIWDAKMTLREAYAALFLQFRLLFEIGNENRRQGCVPLTIRRFLQDYRAYLAMAKSYPPTS